jgi:transmembrane sensor
MNSKRDQYSEPGDISQVDLERKILIRSSGLKVPEGKSREEAFSLLKARIASLENGNAIRHKPDARLIYWISSVAATLLLTLGVWQLLHKPQTKIIAERGSHREYKLPDGTVVTMNAESKITFTGKDFNSDRHLMLEGEAFFKVVQGNSFIISTRYADIKVLGTSFNVSARESAFKVSCITGRVSVSRKGVEIIINPGESASISDNGLVSFHDKNLNAVTGWINGEFYYENAPLSRIFKEMERQFNVNFVVLKMEEKYFTGSFTNKDLVIALDIICIPLGLKYEIGSDNKIFIRYNTLR